MAKQTLPTNFKDDILNSSMGGKRRYKQTTNADGTVSLEDASTYDQVGSNFGASQLNAISKAVNQSADSSKIISDPDTASATTEEGYIADVQLFNHVNDSLGGLSFGQDKNGNWGYRIEGADSVTPFKSGISECKEIWNGAPNSTYTFTESYGSVLIKSTNYSNCFPAITFNNKTPILDISLANAAIMIFSDVKKGDSVTIGGDAQYPNKYAIYELK